MSHYKIVCKCGDELKATSKVAAQTLADEELRKMFAWAKESGMSAECLKALKEKHSYEIVKV